MRRRHKPRSGVSKPYRQPGTPATRKSKAWRKNPFRQANRTNAEVRAAPKATSKRRAETTRTCSPQTSRTDARFCRTSRQAQNEQAHPMHPLMRRTKPKTTRSFRPPLSVFTKAAAQLGDRRNAPVKMQFFCGAGNRPTAFAQKIAVFPQSGGQKLRGKNRKHTKYKIRRQICRKGKISVGSKQHDRIARKTRENRKPSAEANRNHIDYIGMYVPPQFRRRSQQERPDDIAQKHRRKLVPEKSENAQTRQRPQCAADRDRQNMRLLDVHKPQNCLCYFHGESRK